MWPIRSKCAAYIAFFWDIDYIINGMWYNHIHLAICTSNAVELSTGIITIDWYLPTKYYHIYSDLPRLVRYSKTTIQICRWRSIILINGMWYNHIHLAICTSNAVELSTGIITIDWYLPTKYYHIYSDLPRLVRYSKTTIQICRWRSISFTIRLDVHLFLFEQLQEISETKIQMSFIFGRNVSKS